LNSVPASAGGYQLVLPKAQLHHRLLQYFHLQLVVDLPGSSLSVADRPLISLRIIIKIIFQIIFQIVLNSLFPSYRNPSLSLVQPIKKDASLAKLI
jgi:hypothetical protein